MTNWTILQPWWLTLSALALTLLVFGRSKGRQRLPGSWSRIVSPAVQTHLNRWIPFADNRESRVKVASLLVLLGLALANISSGLTSRLPERALHGRVLLMDMTDDASFGAQLFTARQLVTRSPDIPTAIVATAADAYDVVPLTTDPVQLDRYLRVLNPDLMPASGRRLDLGITKANSALQQAKIQAGQVVVLGTGTAPASAGVLSRTRSNADNDAPASATTHWIVVSETPTEDWHRYADGINAEVLTADQLGTLDDRLLARRDDAILASTPVDERQQLTPWFVAACLPLWLMVFFRRREL